MNSKLALSILFKCLTNRYTGFKNLSAPSRLLMIKKPTSSSTHSYNISFFFHLNNYKITLTWYIFYNESTKYLNLILHINVFTLCYIVNFLMKNVVQAIAIFLGFCITKRRIRISLGRLFYKFYFPFTYNPEYRIFTGWPISLYCSIRRNQKKIYLNENYLNVHTPVKLISSNSKVYQTQIFIRLENAKFSPLAHLLLFF